MLNASEWMKVSLAAAGGSTMTVMILLILYNDAAYNEGGMSVQKGENSLQGEYAYSTFPPDATTLGEKAVSGSSCRKVVMILAKRLMRHLAICNKEVKKQYPEKEEFIKHFQCTIRCFMRRVDLVDDRFVMTNQTIDSFVQAQIPERFQNILVQMGKPCLDQYVNQDDGGDPLCIMHGDILKCLQNAIADAC